jgi:hypothetical protein
MTNRILLVAKYSPHFRRALVYTTRCRNADPIENLGGGTVFVVVAPEVRSRLYGVYTSWYYERPSSYYRCVILL